MKNIEKTKIYKYAENWLWKCYGKSSLNPSSLIKEKLKEAIKELERKI